MWYDFLIETGKCSPNCDDLLAGKLFKVSRGGWEIGNLYSILKLSTGLERAVFSTLLPVTSMATSKTITAGIKNIHQANGA